MGSCLLHRFFSSMHCFFVFLFGFMVILCFFKGQYPLEFVQFCLSVSIDSVKATDSDMFVHVTILVHKNCICD